MMARGRLDHDAHERLSGLLRTGDQGREVWFAWNAKEVVRQIYDHTNAELACEWVDQITIDFADREMPSEVHRLRRTIASCRDPIVAWHPSHVSNGPTAAINNLVKARRASGVGMTNFANYSIRALLYARKPNGSLLDTHPTVKREAPRMPATTWLPDARVQRRARADLVGCPTPVST